MKTDMRGRWKRPEVTLEALFARSIPEPNSGCWLWAGAVNQFGYGRANLNGRRMVAHRAAYLLACGPVDPGLELDHLCRVRGCINPAHLEPVTKQVNAIRGAAPTVNAARQRAKTHCPKGHPYSGKNVFVRTRGHRECRTCMAERQRRNASKGARA